MFIVCGASGLCVGKKISRVCRRAASPTSKSMACATCVLRGSAMAAQRILWHGSQIGALHWCAFEHACTSAVPYMHPVDPVLNQIQDALKEIQVAAHVRVPIALRTTGMHGELHMHSLGAGNARIEATSHRVETRIDLLAPTSCSDDFISRPCVTVNTTELHQYESRHASRFRRVSANLSVRCRCCVSNPDVG